MSHQDDSHQDTEHDTTPTPTPTVNDLLRSDLQTRAENRTVTKRLAHHDVRPKDDRTPPT